MYMLHEKERKARPPTTNKQTQNFKMSYNRTRERTSIRRELPIGDRSAFCHYAGPLITAYFILCDEGVTLPVVPANIAAKGWLVTKLG